MRKFKKKGSRKNGHIQKQRRLALPRKIKKALLKQKRKEGDLNALASESKKKRQELRQLRNERRKMIHGIISAEMAQLKGEREYGRRPFVKFRWLSLKSLRIITKASKFIKYLVDKNPKKDFTIKKVEGTYLDGTKVWVKVYP
jgi:hypothetical protein